MIMFLCWSKLVTSKKGAIQRKFTFVTPRISWSTSTFTFTTFTFTLWRNLCYICATHNLNIQLKIYVLVDGVGNNKMFFGQDEKKHKIIHEDTMSSNGAAKVVYIKLNTDLPTSSSLLIVFVKDNCLRWLISWHVLTDMLEGLVDLWTSSNLRRSSTRSIVILSESISSIMKHYYIGGGV